MQCTNWVQIIANMEQSQTVLQDRPLELHLAATEADKSNTLIFFNICLI